MGFSRADRFIVDMGGDERVETQRRPEEKDEKCFYFHSSDLL